MTTGSSGGGETRENPSGWTVDTLRAYMQSQVDMLMASELRQLAHLQTMLDERYLTQTKAVDAAFTAQQTAMTAALAAAETAVSKALEAAEKAVLKAEIAADKRFEAVNEFRAQLSDQATTFMLRREAEAAMQRNADRIDEVSVTVTGLISRAEFNAIHESLVSRVQEATDKLNKAEASSGGALTNRAQLISLITTAASVIAIIIAIYVALKP